jgi:preprotein translocase subunit SecA
VIEEKVRVFCPTDYQEDWDLPGLVAEIGAYYPTRFTPEELAQAVSPEQIIESLLAEATSYYEAREAQLGPENMREIERRVMLSIIDQRWREHLYEMDYLQEGINLRAMGQQDPLVAWQREGYDMFAQMMDAIADDFVRYVMHMEVVVEQPTAPALRNVEYSAAEDPVEGQAALRRAAALQVADPEAPVVPEADEVAARAPVVKSAEEKLGRNQPCWCGSGKKFKHCHGR